MKTQQMIDEELEMQLLDALDIEEEEEEEELDLEEEEEIDDDRGDDVDPDLPDDDAEEVDTDADDADAGDADDDLDAEALAELAGEEGKSRSVPHSRFNEVNEQWKIERAARLQLEEEMARLRGEKPAPKDEPQAEPEPEFDFKSKRKALREATYEGDTDAAEKLEEEIEAANLARMEKLAEQRAESKYQERMEKERQERETKEAEQTLTAANAAAVKAAEEYPFLNSQSADADADAIDEVIALRDLYLKRGDSAADAITKAADKVGARYAPAEEADPRTPAKPTRAQLERNLDRAGKIPPRNAGVGERSQKIDYENLTEEQFDNLPSDEKRKARGDYVG